MHCYQHFSSSGQKITTFSHQCKSDTILSPTLGTYAYVPSPTPMIFSIKFSDSCTFMYIVILQYLMWSDFCSLGDKTKGGRCVVLAIGATEEVVYSSPGQHSIILSSRFGFVKKAIIHG